MMASQNLLVEEHENYAKVTINRPEKLNALDTRTVTELYQIMKRLHETSAMRAIILTGAGEKAFAAGADIAEITHHDEYSGKVFALRGQKVFRYIERMSIPVIAAINGYALGGGCELAMSCHLRLASTRAKFGQPEINLGILPGYGGTQRLPRLIGRTQALYYLLSGDIIDAQKALELGLVNQVVEPEKLLPRAREWAKSLAVKAPVAVKYILQATSQGIEVNLDAGLNLEAELFGKICATEDMKEGTQAFLEKRKPKFKGK